MNEPPVPQPGPGAPRRRFGPAAPERPIAADWLTLRRFLDEKARESARGMLAQLAAAFADRPADPAPGNAIDSSAPIGPGALIGPGVPIGPGAVAVVDVGAGTGANRAYLAPRLPFPTRWTLLDHDPALLAAADNEGCRRVLGGIDQLPGLLAELGPGPRLVTCSALLDLLSTVELDALLAAVVEQRVPALLALTVTGAVHLDPADPDDQLIAAAFDAHQARAGRPGPQATAYLAGAARTAGATVAEASTPWLVSAATDEDAATAGTTTAGTTTAAPDTAATGAFLRRYLTDRAAAAAEQLQLAGRPQDSHRVTEWLSRRLAAVDQDRLSLRVDHTDLLILPT